MPLIPLDLKKGFTIILAFWTDTTPNSVLHLHVYSLQYISSTFCSTAHFTTQSHQRAFTFTEQCEHSARRKSSTCVLPPGWDCWYALKLAELLWINIIHLAQALAGFMWACWESGQESHFQEKFFLILTKLHCSEQEQKKYEELKWIYYFSEYFHNIRTTPAMLIRISSDILKLTQLENSFVHVNCLQTRLKLISAGRLEVLQRSV